MEEGRGGEKGSDTPAHTPSGGVGYLRKEQENREGGGEEKLDDDEVQVILLLRSTTLTQSVNRVRERL